MHLRAARCQRSHARFEEEACCDGRRDARGNAAVRCCVAQGLARGSIGRALLTHGRWWTANAEIKCSRRDSYTNKVRLATVTGRVRMRGVLLTLPNKTDAQHEGQAEPGEKCRNRRRGVAYQSEVGMLAERWMDAKQ